MLWVSFPTIVLYRVRCRLVNIVRTIHGRVAVLRNILEVLDAVVLGLVD